MVPTLKRGNRVFPAPAGSHDAIQKSRACICMCRKSGIRCIPTLERGKDTNFQKNFAAFA